MVYFEFVMLCYILIFVILIMSFFEFSDILKNIKKFLVYLEK